MNREAEFWRLVAFCLAVALIVSGLTKTDCSKPPNQYGTSGDHLVMVEESGGRPAWRVIVLDDDAFFSSIEGRWHRFDPDQAAAETYKSAAFAKGVEPPFAMRVSESGDVVNVIPFPHSSDVLKDLMQ